MITLLACIFGILCLWFALSVLTMAWRVVDAIVQGVPRGLRLTWRTFRAMVRALRSAERSAQRFDTWLGQRVHAAYWTWSYWLKRAYIASQLRARRRERA